MSQLLKDPSAIEQRLLELAHTTDAKLTVPALAYFAPCSLDDAARVLDDLTTRDRLSMEVEDDGTIVYELHGRQKLSGLPRPPHAASVLRPEVRSLVPVMRGPSGPSPALAAVLTMFVPGAGHLYAGRFVAALLWFAVVGLGYALILPGLVLHLFAIASATVSAARRQLESTRVMYLPAPRAA